MNTALMFHYTRNQSRRFTSRAIETEVLTPTVLQRTAVCVAPATAAPRNWSKVHFSALPLKWADRWRRIFSSPSDGRLRGGQGEPGGTRAMGVCEPGQDGNGAAISITFMCLGEPPRLSPAPASSSAGLGFTATASIVMSRVVLLFRSFIKPQGS
jgi:hypothetical protein